MSATEYGWVPDKEMEDEWCCIWKTSRKVPNIGQVIKSPIQNLDDLKKYKFPDPHAKGRFDRINEQIKEGNNKYILNNPPELATYLKYPEELRRIIYTTNTVENYHRALSTP